MLISDTKGDGTFTYINEALAEFVEYAYNSASSFTKPEENFLNYFFGKLKPRFDVYGSINRYRRVAWAISGEATQPATGK